MSSTEVEEALARPDSELLEALLALPESQWFERKSGRIKAKDLARPLIAFANAEGGTLMLGVHDNKLEGISPQSENEIRQAAIDYTVPPVRTRITNRRVEGKTLLFIQVEPSETVHTTQSGDCFLRIGDESRKLSLAEHQELIYDRGNSTFEATMVDLAVSDLDQPALKEYQLAIGSSSVEEMLAARDLVTRQGKLTVAAELLFDGRPQRDFPSAYVRVLKYNTDERGVGAEMTLIEDERIEGSIPNQITEATRLIEKLVPRRRQLTINGRFEPVPTIPRDAWLEGLVNAVIHRSYSIMGDHVRFEIFPSRIEVSSPGRFPGLVNPSEPLTISRYARNPRIARVCADMGFTRELGEGIKRIFSEMRRRGLTEPIYRQTASSVTLVLSAADAIAPDILNRLSKSAIKVLTVMRLQDRPLGTGQVAELADIARPTASRALQSLANEGLVAWEGTSDKDPTASWRLL